MFWKTVSCEYCNGYVPLRPRLFDLRAMPKRPACPGCGMTNEAPPSWRYTYYFHYAWRLAALAAIPLVAWDAQRHAYFEPIWLVATTLAAMVLGGFLASFALAIPVWIVVEAMGHAVRPLLPRPRPTAVPEPEGATDASVADVADLNESPESPEPSEYRRSA